MEDLLESPNLNQHPTQLMRPTGSCRGTTFARGRFAEGWTMDQWKWYGQQWLDSQK